MQDKEVSYRTSRAYLDGEKTGNPNPLAWFTK